MPFDPNRTRELIRSANHHRNHPGGELMLAIAEQLDFAAKEIAGANDAARSANVALTAAERALADERASVREFQDNSAKLIAILEGMRQIAVGVKAPKKLAHDLLNAHGLADAPEAPAEAVVK